MSRDKVFLVGRGGFYDVLIDNKKVGSGSWGLLATAYYFYRQEGMEVEIVYE